jgi:hypothetical protein
MAKTYADLRYTIAEKKYIDMEVPHPNGNVYLITEEKDKNINEVFRCEIAVKDSMGWFVMDISKKAYSHTDVSCALSDLDFAFKNLMPTL